MSKLQVGLTRLASPHYAAIFWRDKRADQACFFVLILALLLFPDPSHSEVAQPDEFSQIELCLRSEPEHLQICIGTISATCIASSSNAADEPRHTDTNCFLKELSLWKRLNVEFVFQLQSVLPEDAYISFRKEQDYWEQGKHVYCYFPFEHVWGTWVNSGAAKCYMDYEAERAIRLFQYVQLTKIKNFVGSVD
ncbi:MAG: hypothetical protein ACPG5U_02490 [Planktomarina sp.]